MKSSNNAHCRDEGARKCPWNSWTCGHPEADGTYACPACRYQMALTLDRMIGPEAVIEEWSERPQKYFPGAIDRWLACEGQANQDHKPRWPFAALERLHTGWEIQFHRGDF